jgi:ankyrin repeat protein
MPRNFLLVLFVSTGLASSGCNLRGEWYDPITGQRWCAAAPPAIDYWASGPWLRRPEDRTELEGFLRRHPGAVNARYGRFCETPLHLAARRGREDVAPVLIAHGADLRARDKRGETPIQVAATLGQAKIMTLLLAAGADANASGPSEKPPLHNAVAGVPGASDPESGLAVTRLLLAAGADVNAKDPGDGRTALIDAIGSGPRASDVDIEPMIALLVAHGADVRARDSQGTPALAYATGTGNRRVVALLLDRGAGADASGKKDQVALGVALSGAAYEGYVEIAALLIERGADVNWRFPGPQRIEWRALPLASALTVARSVSEPRMARRREVALALLAHGADVNARNESEETLLHAAAIDGDMAAIELLLSHGADVAARDRAGFTPLHRAIQKGHVDATTRLIASGADANAVTTGGTTALDLASGDREMEALVRRHAKH